MSKVVTEIRPRLALHKSDPIQLEAIGYDTNEDTREWPSGTVISTRSDGVIQLEIVHNIRVLAVKRYSDKEWYYPNNYNPVPDDLRGKIEDIMLQFEINQSYDDPQEETK